MVYLALSDDSSTESQFTRRKKITITTSGTSTPVGYQIKFTIDFESEMQADFEDIRFNTQAGEYIDYWVESYTASTTAIVWVELPDAITDPGSDYIWMYYGNISLSDGSDVGDTFVFGDDFPGSSLDTGKWTEQLKGTGGSIVVSGGECALTIPDDQIVSASIESDVTFTNNIEIRIRRKCPDDVEYIGTTLGSGALCDASGGTSDWWLTTRHSAYDWCFQDQVDPSSNEIYEMPASGARQDLSSNDASCSASEINNYSIFKYSYDSSGNLGWKIILEDTVNLGEGFEKYDNNPFTLPGDSTGYGAVHPSVIYFPSGEDGYKYWMYYEKGVTGPDCEVYLVRSNDGLTWVETGVTNPILDNIATEEHIPDPNVIKVGSTWYLFIVEGVGGDTSIQRLTSTDGKSWTDATTVISRGGTGTWDEDDVVSPSCIYENGTFYLWYVGEDAGLYRLGLATSTDGTDFTKDGSNPIYGGVGNETWHIDVVYSSIDNKYWLYYNLENDTNYPMYLAKSTDRKNFTQVDSNPVMEKSGTGWELTRLYKMACLKDVNGNMNLVDGVMWFYYSAFNTTTGVYRIGLAESWDSMEVDRLLADATDTTFLSDSKKILISQGAYSAASRGATSYLDFVIAGKYIANVPIKLYGSEETPPSPMWYYQMIRRRN